MGYGYDYFYEDDYYVSSATPFGELLWTATRAKEAARLERRHLTAAVAQIILAVRADVEAELNDEFVSHGNSRVKRTPGSRIRYRHWNRKNKSITHAWCAENQPAYRRDVGKVSKPKTFRDMR